MRKWTKCRAVLEEDLFTLHPWLRIGESEDMSHGDACYGRRAPDSSETPRLADCLPHTKTDSEMYWYI